MVDKEKWVSIRDIQGGMFNVKAGNVLALMQFPCGAPTSECPIRVHRQVMIPIPNGGFLEVSKEELLRVARELEVEGFTLIPDDLKKTLGGLQ